MRSASSSHRIHGIYAESWHCNCLGTLLLSCHLLQNNSKARVNYLELLYHLGFLFVSDRRLCELKPKIYLQVIHYKQNLKENVKLEYKTNRFIIFVCLYNIFLSMIGFQFNQTFLFKVWKSRIEKLSAPLAAENRAPTRRKRLKGY